MKKLIPALITASLVVFLSACGSSPSKPDSASQQACNFLPPEPQPSWVSGDSQIAGFYTGVGDSDASQNSNSATQVARQRALANLSSSIQTNVSQQLSIQIKESSTSQGGSKDLQKDLANQTRSITENLIKNSIRDDVWLDRRGCRLWMRMKVAKSGVEEIQKKNRQQARLNSAKEKFEIASDRTQVDVKRLENIEDAIKLLEKVDFSMLPLEDAESYISKYRKLQTQILTQAGSNELIVITLSEQDVPKSVHKELAYRLTTGLDKAKHIYPAPCKDRDSCLDLALDLHSKRMITVAIQTSTSIGEMGSRLGELTIDASLYDVESRRKLSQLKNQKGQVLSFDVRNMPWTQAIDRLFDGNATIKQLKTTAKDCSVKAC